MSDLEAEFMGAGFSVVQPGSANDGGLVAHRGVLHPDEYIDTDALRDVALEALGFSYEDVSSVYARGGRLSPEQRQLRERIDSRLLALSRSGGSMISLSVALDMSEKTIDRALARARDIEVAPQVKNPAVLTVRVCFKAGTSPAKPRKRRHAGCPSHLLPSEQNRGGTIDLNDENYANGFRNRPGNPAYWTFRDRAATPRGA